MSKSINEIPEFILKLENKEMNKFGIFSIVLDNSFTYFLIRTQSFG